MHEHAAGHRLLSFNAAACPGWMHRHRFLGVEVTEAPRGQRFARERFAQLYMDPQFRGPKEFAAVIAESEVNFRKVVDQLGLKPE